MVPLPSIDRRFALRLSFNFFTTVTRLVVSLVALAALIGAGPAEMRAQTAQTLHRHVRKQVADHSAPFVSYLPSNQQINLSIVLPLRNQAALTSLLTRLYDPTSPDYRKFLSVSDFTQQFSPTQQDYQAVVSYAQTNGMTITGDPANRLVVPVSGTVDQINSAFSVRMSLYQYPGESRTFFSLDREPSLGLSAPVAHISGLDNFAPPRHMSMRRSSSGQSVQSSAATVTGSGPGGSYLGSDMRAAYYGGTTLDGNGQAVGLVEFGGYLLSDVNSTFSNAGQTYSVPINNVLLDGTTGAPVGDDAEQTLDIAQAIGMAPGLSQVRVYIGAGSDDAALLNSMASENLAKQLSSSWMWRPADPTTDDVFFQEMAAQGQSFFVASGDYGAYDGAIDPYFYPADDQYVTAVGGTHLSTNGAGGGWVSESVWNSSNVGEITGSGGGISQDGISIPSWQAGLATTANGGSTTLRNVPDVAMEGDFDNYACNLGDCEGDYAGTSFAAPRWAAFMALVNQQAVEAGNAPSGGVGFLNPSLYQLAQGPDASTDLHDTTTGNNDTDHQPIWYSALPGYDLTTGWGSAAGQGLINDLAGPQVPGFWIASSLSTITLNPGNTGSANVLVTDAGGFTGGVNFAVTSQLPSGVTASFSPSATTGTTLLTLAATSSTTNQTVTITVTGTSGNLTASTNITLSVHTASFLLSAAPAAVGINQNGSGTSTIVVTPQYGFTGNVTLAASGLPNGVTALFSPAMTSGTSVLTLTSSGSAAPGSATVTITGTSGSVTATTNVLLTIQAPTFVLEGGETLGIGQGGNGTAFIYVNDEYGFNGNVMLAVSGLPSGVTAAFSQNPTTYASTLTLAASSTASVGQSKVIVTGTSGSLTSTATIALGVYAPTFTVYAPSTLSVGQGTSTTTYTYVEPVYGFTGSVAFSVTGLPSGVTASFSPNPTTGTSSVILTAASATAIGQYTLTIKGTSGSVSASTTMQLGIFAPTFTLSDGTATLGQGTSTTDYVYVSPQYGFTGSVNLSVSGLPSGVTGTFSPNPTNGQSVLTLIASTSAAVGQYNATITGVYGTQTVTTTLPIGIYTPTFSISGYGTGTVGQGTSTQMSVYISPSYGFTGNVTLAVSGLPSGVTASFSPNPSPVTAYGGTGTLTLTASSTAALGQYTLKITGTSGTQTASTTATLGVYQPTFTLSAYSSPTLGQGTSVTQYIYVNDEYGFTGGVNFAISGLPSGVTGVFSPNPSTGTTILTLTASSTAKLGQYTATITGTSGAQTATTSFTLGVYTPTFTLSSNGSISAGQGQPSTAYVYVSSQYGFAGNVSFTVAGLPSGVTAAFSPNPTTYSSALTFTVSSSAAVGASAVTITGTSGSQTVTTTLLLNIFSPTFTLYNENSALSLNVGATGSAYLIVQPQYGFNSNVIFTASGLPSGVTAAFSPNTTSSTYITMTLAANANAAPGSATVTITGTAGSVSASTPLILTINTPSYLLSNAPSTLTLDVGGSGKATIAVVPQYGFTGNVSFAATGLPNGVTAAFSPSTTTSSSAMTLFASSSAALGSSTVTVTGTSGSLTANTLIPLTINAAETGTSTALTLNAGDSATSSVTSGTAVTATAQVTAGSAAVTTGQVNFCDATATYCDSIHLLGSAQITSAGTAVLPFIPGPGTRSYKAVYAGTGNNAASTSATANLTVTASIPTTATIAQTGSAGNYTLTATVSGKGPLAPAGDVSFVDTSKSNISLGTATLGSGSSVLGLSVTSSPATANTPESMVTADFNGDGIPDLAVASPNSGISILLGKGDGTFQSTASGVSVIDTTGRIAAGDFNRDGRPDLVVSLQFTNALLVFLGNGDGTFTASSSSPQTGYNPSGMAIGDFNGDGVLDLATANSEGNTLTILLGNGDGTFTTSSGSPQTQSGPNAVAEGDFNGDGIADLAVSNSYSSSITILLGNGDGTFVPLSATPSTNSYPGPVAVADLNQDGKLDLVVASQGGLTILLGNGDGTFTAAPNAVSSAWYTSVAVADLNNDGKPDIALTNDYTSAITTLLGNGDGTFTAGPTPSIGGYPAALVSGDWNGDGIPDLASANSQNSTVSVVTTQLSQTATGTASSISANGQGQHTVAASYAGNGTYASSTSATTTLTGEGTTPPTVTLTLSAGTITSTQALSVTVAVSGGSGNPIPTGSITLTGGGYTSTIMTLANASVVITIPAGSLAIGTDTLTATYTPDTASANLYSGASGTSSVTIQKITPTVTVTLSASSITASQGLTVTVAVSGGSGNPMPSGSVTLTAGSYSSQQTLANGSAIFTVAAGALPAGSDVMQAAYTPDASGAAVYTTAAQVATVTLTTGISKIAPTITVAASPLTLINLQPDTVTATIAGAAGQALPTGSIILSSGSYSSQEPLAGGTLVFTIPAGALATGSDILTAAYSGDSIYAAASGTATVAVASVVITGPSLSSVVRGSSASGNVVFNSGSYSGTMSLTCTLSSSPSGGQYPPTCSITPASVTLVSSGTASATLTVTTTAASVATLELRPSLPGRALVCSASLLLPALLLLGAPARRRRMTGLMILLFGIMVAGISGCGGGSNQTAQPTMAGTTSGSYAFTITATDSNLKVTTSTSVSFVVQ